MQCKQCSTTWKLSGADGPIGNAAPGHYMIVAGILAAVALVLGVVFKSLGGIAIGLLVIAITGMALVGCGIKEKKDLYQGSECPECGHKNRIMPWDF